MIDLQLSSGLPIKFDELAEQFQYGEGIIFDSLDKVPLSSMLPGLLNKSLRYPENVYLQHRNIHHVNDDPVFKNGGFNFDILMLPSGLMGVEFIRSHIFYTDCAGEEAGISEIVEVLSGSLTVLLQRNKPKLSDLEFETKVSEGLVIRLSRGEKFVVPTNYYYTFINAKEKPVVFSRFYANRCKCDYTQFRREQGLAYFAIRKNAKQEIVLNPRYREIPKIKRTTADQIVFKNKPTINRDPLYSQIVSNLSQCSSWLS